MPTDPKSAKKTDDLTVFCVLLESVHVKVEDKSMGEIDLREGQFHQNFMCRFIYAGFWAKMLWRRSWV